MIETTLCYLEKDGAYLMLHRIKKERDVNKDKWIGVGGKLEPGETPEQCAARELVEETGFRAGKLTSLGVMYPAAAYTREAVHIYFGEQLTAEKQNLDEDEFLTVEHIDFDEALRMVMSGEIRDAKTQIAILKLNSK